VLEHVGLARIYLQIVFTGLGKTEIGVWAAAYRICVMVVLTIVLPITDGTDLEVATPKKRFVSTARTAIGLRNFSGTRGIH
jgi:hypothetical protein